MRFGPFRPQGCERRVSGNFLLHPKGWGFFGGGSEGHCELQWSLGTETGAYEGKRHLGDLPKRWTGVASAAIDPSGTLAGVVTSSGVGHMTRVLDSVFVFRLEDGHELFRRHLPLTLRRYSDDAVVVFVGERQFAFSLDGVVRVFRVPSELD